MQYFSELSAPHDQAGDCVAGAGGLVVPRATRPLRTDAVSDTATSAFCGVMVSAGPSRISNAG
jgi:hypothetical protein